MSELVLHASKICELIRANLPNRWEGKECIMKLKNAHYEKSWRNTEWAAFYFEYTAFKVLVPIYGKHPGPKIGLTRFDFVDNFNHVWDLKTHSLDSSNHWLILNDKNAVDICLKNYNGMGLIVAEGDAEYDDALGSFKYWHNQLKGKPSKYEEQRIERGAPSRRMKKAFTLRKLEAFWLDSIMIDNSLASGKVKLFQTGMRNADGSPRRPKYMINLGEAPYEARLASI